MKILILSSSFTGYGHKSITESLCEQLVRYENVHTDVIDGFALAGNIGVRVGKLYGAITRNAKDLWKLTWEISHKRPSLINDFTLALFKTKFLAYLKKNTPDLIVSVHPNFVGSVLDILEDEKIKLPFVAILADLVSISPLWADARADITICPTDEAKYKCMDFGVPESKIRVLSFPVRERFCNHGRTFEDNTFTPDKVPTFLIMSGGEGSGNMGNIARILLNNFNCKIKILAGRNKVLKARLERNLSLRYPGRFEVLGFTEDVQDVMLSSDLGFMRASPNTVMEAINCTLPAVITGALPGQEEGNPGFVQKNNLGVVCKKTSQLKSVVQDLLADNGRKLNQIRQNQENFRDPDAGKKIAEFLVNLEIRG